MNKVPMVYHYIAQDEYELNYLSYDTLQKNYKITSGHTSLQRGR